MLLPEDLQFAANAENMLAKNRIIGEAYNLFGRLAESYKNFRTIFTGHLLKQHPKFQEAKTI